MSGLRRGLAPPGNRVGYDPDVVGAALSALEKIISAVRGPLAAALGGWIVPARKQGMHVAAISTDFPKCRGVIGDIGNRKADAGPSGDNLMAPGRSGAVANFR